MKQTYTQRDKGRAVFLAALMVLSVFAMSVSFTGAAAADATEVTVAPTTVDLTDEDPDNVTVEVSHAQQDTQAAIAIVNEDGEVVYSELATNVTGDATTFDDIDVSDLDEGEYTVYATAGVDITAPQEGADLDENWAQVSATLTISAPEPSEPNGQFDESVYQEEAGDTAEFTVELENADSGTVTIEEANTNYEAELEVEDGNDDGEVTVEVNTYLAGSGEDGTFSATDDDDSVTVVNENAEFNYEEGERLLPASLNLELLVNDERVDVATLQLTEGSIDSVSSGTAPSDADLDDVDSIVESATESDEIAEGDRVLFSFEASGVVGAIEAGNFEDYFNLVLEQTNDQYDEGTELDEDQYEIVEDPENDRFFVVLTEDAPDMEAGDEFELRLEPETDDDGNIDSLYFIDDEEYKKGSGTIVSTQFSIVERMVEFAGMDKEDVLRVPISEEATISGETTVAPGSDIRVSIEDGDEVPFLMTATVEVDEDGTFTATFDTSEQEVGQEFEATAEILQLLDDGDVSTTVDAVFVESADDGEEKKGDEKKQDGEYQPDGDDKQDEQKDNNDKQNDNNDKQKDNNDKQKDNNDKQNDNNDDQQGDDNNDDEQPGSGADEQPGFGIAVALVALLAAAGFALRHQ